ncbi:MAG: hypothetical protein H5U26_13770 [Immundisolibacter sp.]|uniref:hypothetical protein n=1 Tax=Immundisolibacter sp. TaxID=1934948 RepID=UPI0019951D0F|nr:hypothetical protein [Immundisolibacter sp.]MBC7163158.1 hypothetical protein [Immundisolibacter sp.]
MSEDKKAGQLILSQLKMFNEAAVLFEQVVEPAILKGIDVTVDSFAEKNDWDGEYELESDNDCWLAPKAWITNPGEEGPKFKAQFAIDYIDGDDDFWSALFCDVATQGGRAGFLFKIDVGAFGLRNTRSAWVKTIPQELISKLTALGFQNRNKGNFFLPVTLDNQMLANSFLEYGEFTEDDDIFAPLLSALEILKQAVPIFDQIMQYCSAACGPVGDRLG